MARERGTGKLTKDQLAAKEKLKPLADTFGLPHKAAAELFDRLVTAHCRCGKLCGGLCPPKPKPADGASPSLAGVPAGGGSMFQQSYNALAGGCLYQISRTERIAITKKELLNELDGVKEKVFNSTFAKLQTILKQLDDVSGERAAAAAASPLAAMNARAKRRREVEVDAREMSDGKAQNVSSTRGRRWTRRGGANRSTHSP